MPSYVSYESNNTGVRIARLLRLYWIWQNAEKNEARPVAGKNIAVILINKSVSNSAHNLAVTAVSDPSSEHSERIGIARLKDLIAGRNPPIVGDVDAYINHCSRLGYITLYTERAPCTTGPGMRNCAGFLADNYPDMPVFYSFNYPSSGRDELNEVLAILNDLDIFDEENCMTLREYYQSLGKEDRSAVTKALQATDSLIRKKYKGQYKTETGRQIEQALEQLGYLPY